MLLLIPWFKLHGWPLIGKLQIQPFGILVALGILVGSRSPSGEQRRPREAAAHLRLPRIHDGLRFSRRLSAQQARVRLGRVRGDVHEPSLILHRYMGSRRSWVSWRRRRRVLVSTSQRRVDHGDGDLFCFAFPFAWFFGRMGCFTVHDHPGLVSHFFLAVDNYNEQGLPRHDLGFYEVLWSAAAISLNLWLGKSARPRGFFMAFIPIFYAPVRFFLDGLREIPLHGGDVRYYGFTPASTAPSPCCSPASWSPSASHADRKPPSTSTAPTKAPQILRRPISHQPSQRRFGQSEEEA